MKRLVFIIILLFAMAFSASAQLKERDNLLGGSIGFWAKRNVPTFSGLTMKIRLHKPV